jgi:hypothetical protein
MLREAAWTSGASDFFRRLGRSCGYCLKMDARPGTVFPGAAPRCGEPAGLTHAGTGARPAKAGGVEPPVTVVEDPLTMVRDSLTVVELPVTVSEAPLAWARGPSMRLPKHSPPL